MAGTKAIKKRITAVKNTRKITKTMEMVSTAKSKRLVDRVNAARPYGQKLTEILQSLQGLEGELNIPYLRRLEDANRMLILVVTANRGLCGGYNSNVLKLALRRIRGYQEQGVEPEVHVIGKKGLAYFRFLKVPVAKQYIDIDDTLEYVRAEELSREFLARFVRGEFSGMEIVSTIYHSSSQQSAEAWRFLPLETGGPGEGEKQKGLRDVVLYEPDPESLLKELLPHLLKNLFYRRLLEAMTSEQIARRIAMKSATDNAGEMGKMLNIKYNRMRQASITQELSEIVAGADAL